MAAARHKMPPEIASLSLEEIADSYIGRFRDKTPDWEAFEDAKIDGYRRAQHRFIGAGGSGKHDDPTVIPPRAFTLSIISARQGRATPRIRTRSRRCFILQGILTVFIEDESGRQLRRRLGALGMHRLPAWRHPRLSEREPRAGVFPGHARQRQARGDGLCGR